jgi:hypothetical protein
MMKLGIDALPNLRRLRRIGKAFFREKCGCCDKLGGNEKSAQACDANQGAPIGRGRQSRRATE